MILLVLLEAVVATSQLNMSPSVKEVKAIVADSVNSRVLKTTDSFVLTPKMTPVAGHQLFEF